jgi:uncharacterized Fe-S cluster-containing MiaB family protein
MAEASHIRADADRIPTDLREKVLEIVKFAEETQKSYDLIVDVTARDAERRIHDIMFLEAQIKNLIVAIRSAADVSALRVKANEAIERIRQRRRKSFQRCIRQSLQG